MIVCIAATCFIRGATAQILVTDDFENGVLNTGIWTTPLEDQAALVENGGRLRFCTLGDNTNYSHFAKWSCKKTFSSATYKFAEAQVLVRMKEGTGAGSQVLYAGVQFLRTNAMGVVYLALNQTAGRTYFFVQAQGPNPLLGFSRGYEVPVASRQYYLKLRYFHDTGLVSFWWRLPDNPEWTRVCKSTNLKTLWDNPPVIGFRPGIYGQAGKKLVPLAEGVYMDHFLFVAR
jgi:hypothetical protein